STITKSHEHKSNSTHSRHHSSDGLTFSTWPRVTTLSHLRIPVRAIARCNSKYSFSVLTEATVMEYRKSVRPSDPNFGRRSHPKNTDRGHANINSSKSIQIGKFPDLNDS